MNTLENIILVDQEEDLLRCFPLIQELRPHLNDPEAFVEQIKRQMAEGYLLFALEYEDQIVSCIGFRFFETLAWGKLMYIDDLATLKAHQGKGFASMLLSIAIEIAKEEGCQQVHLDTGYQRHQAHRVYLENNFQFHCHHMSLVL